jgi:hypothetical protein
MFSLVNLQTIIYLFCDRDEGVMFRSIYVVDLLNLIEDSPLCTRLFTETVVRQLPFSRSKGTRIVLSFPVGQCEQ